VIDRRPSAGTILRVVGILATLALFVAIAAVQSRWITQLSDAELQLSRLRLQQSIKAISNDVNRELMAAYSLFQLPPGSTAQSWGPRTYESYEIWTRKTKYPSLVRGLFVAQPDENGTLQIASYNGWTRRYEPIPWPAHLNDLRRQLTLPFSKFEVFGVRTFTGIALAGGPVLICPIHFQTANFDDPKGWFTQAKGWLVIEIDEQLLLTKLLPAVIQENVDQSDQFDYQIVSDTLPHAVVFRSNPKVQLSSTDATGSLLALGWEYFTHGIGEGSHDGQGWISSMVNLPGQPAPLPGDAGVWQLQVRHRSGSLEAAASGLRRSDLLLGLAMMVLVTADLAILALLARRAYRLGQAKLQFAAAVSHELRTPLAAICSAADNLAAGVSHEPMRVQQYGAAILQQGKQLTDLVEQILSFATGQEGRQHYELEMMELGPVVLRATAVVGPAVRDSGMEIEVHVPAKLPPILGDATAIHQALINLLTNANKYGAAGGWIGVSVCDANVGELQVNVEDKGPGIPAREIKHIFEPFRRGSAAANPNVRGAGLGLTIVDQIARAHGGRVTVVSTPGHGSRFTLHLPTI
jgi:two-component system phosphate regulon sensor histidine kinase PhoR